MTGPLDDDEYESMLMQEGLILSAQELVANALERRGITMRQLARLMKQPVRKVYRWMSGERDMTVRNLAQMLHALGCNPVQLSGGDVWEPDGWVPLADGGTPQ